MLLNLLKINDLIISATNLHAAVDSFLRDHNYRVAFIAVSIGSKLTYSVSFLRNLLLAGLFHDVGILLFREKNQTYLLKSETAENLNVHLHAFIGYKLLKDYPSFAKVAKIIRDHHRTYKEFLENPKEITFSSQIIYLSDRIDVFMNTQLEKGVDLFKAVELLKEKLLKLKGSVFHPKLVDLFLHFFLPVETFWFELYLEPSYFKDSIANWLKKFSFAISYKEFLKIINLFGYIIDFKSPFTATHSSGVAQTAVQLASYFQFSPAELRKMRIAGFLHDIGKLFIPKAILEKEGKLTEAEFNTIKTHVYYTYKILSEFIDDGEIVKWAAYHHERLNGKGYPFKLKANQIPLGSRIMAVADIFTALTESRPYKKAMSSEDALKLIVQLAEKGEVDRKVVNVLSVHLKTINKGRLISQEKALKVYQSLRNVVSDFESLSERPQQLS